MSKKIELKTERLILRPVVEQNTKAIFNYRSDSTINKYQGWIPESIKDVIGDLGIHMQLPGDRNYARILK